MAAGAVRRVLCAVGGSTYCRSRASAMNETVWLSVCILANTSTYWRSRAVSRMKRCGSAIFLREQERYVAAGAVRRALCAVGAART